MSNPGDVSVFERARPRLMGLAYRILGSRADAEDAVQDTFLKWRAAGGSGVENPDSWLTTACTRRCIDMLRAAHRTRIEYIGPWLPEPIQTLTEDDPDEAMSLASSLSTAFLLLLERLTPKERAAYLLREIFEVPYPEIAATLDIRESTCRKLVSRARANIDRAKVRHVTPVERQEQLLAAFEAAVADGRPDRLAALLSDDIELRADSGGKVPAILRVLRGKAEVLDFLARARAWWASCDWTLAGLNGGRAFVLRENGAATTALCFAYDEVGAVTNIYIMRNPDKLARLDEAPNAV